MWLTVVVAALPDGTEVTRRSLTSVKVCIVWYTIAMHCSIVLEL